MKIALLFPGYGSQFVGMGKELYDTYRVVQEYFEEASNCLNINAVKLCFASSDVELSRMENAYTSIFLVSTALFALLQEEGIKVDAVAGYNQGEYAALFAAGGINLPDGLYFLKKLASFYQALLDNEQLAAIRIMGIETKQLEEICLKTNLSKEGKAFIAVYLGEREHIVAGNHDAVERLKEIMGDIQGVSIDYAATQVGMHSPLMDPVVDQIKMYREKMDFKDLHTPLIESLNGTLITKSSAIRDQILKNINNPVMWTRVMKQLAGYDVIVEVGPGSTLAKRAKEWYPDKQILSINKKEDVDQLKQLAQKAHALRMEEEASAQEEQPETEPIESEKKSADQEQE